MVAHEALPAAGARGGADGGRRERAPAIGGLFFLFLLTWPVLASNALIRIPGDPGHWITMPAAARFVEPVVLLGALFGSYLFGRPLRYRFLISLVRCTAAIVVAGLVGSLLAFPGLFNMLYGVYEVIVCLLALVAVLACGFDRKELRKLMGYLAILGAVNCVVGVAQIAVLGVAADNVHGLYNDANTMSTVLYIVSGFCLYYYTLTRSLRHLAYGLGLIPIAYLAFNEKLNLFFLVLMAPLVLLRMRKQVFSIGLAAVAGVVLVVSTARYAERSGVAGRTAVVSDLIAERGGPLTLGVFRSWPTAWEQINDGPASLLFGSGASNFGGPVAAGRFNRGTATLITTELFAVQTSAAYLGAFDSPTNYFSNVLGEFGVVGLIATLVWLARVVFTLHVIGLRHPEPDIIAWAWAAKWGWLMVAMQALFVPFGVFENLAVIAPLALITGIVVVEWLPYDRSSRQWSARDRDAILSDQ